MNYMIIPEFSDIQRTLLLTTKYDVCFEYNDFTNPDVYENEQEIERRIQKYKSLGRDMSTDTMHGVFLGIDIAASDPVLQNRCKRLCMQSLDIADRMGVMGVVFHTGLIGQLRLEYYLNHWLEESVDFYSELCGKYPQITIFIENSFEQSPDIFVRLMQRMKDVPNFKICLDYGHAVLTQTPISVWVKELARYVGHVHLNDNDLIDDLHLVPGEGKIDFGEYRRLMNEYKIDVSVLLEVSGNDRIERSILAMKDLVDF